MLWCVAAESRPPTWALRPLGAAIVILAFENQVLTVIRLSVAGRTRQLAAVGIHGSTGIGFGPSLGEPGPRLKWAAVAQNCSRNDSAAWSMTTREPCNRIVQVRSNSETTLKDASAMRKSRLVESAVNGPAGEHRRFGKIPANGP